VKYQGWIKENVTEAYGKCVEVTKQMLEAFPELTRVKGHYHCPFDGKRPHWWLKTDQGVVVDPTASQFLSGGIMGEYEEWKEGRPEPTGKCMDCGGYCYNNSNFCTQKCLDAYSEYAGWKKSTL